MIDDKTLQTTFGPLEPSEGDEQKMRIYLAGPMTDIPQFNFPEFKRVAAGLRQAGHEVFSPAEYEEERFGVDAHSDNIKGSVAVAEASLGFSLRDALKADLCWICEKAEGIHMMRGWENSKGARTEHALAVALGLTITYENT